MEVSGQETFYPLNGRSGGPQSFPRSFGEEENILPLLRYEN